MIKGIKKVFKNAGIMIAILLVIFSSSIAVVKAAGPAYSFDFMFSGSTSMRWTELEKKNTAQYLSMQCTMAEFAGTSYYAYASNYDGNYSLGTKKFYQGTWHALANLIYESGFHQAKIDAYVTPDCGVPSNGASFGGYWYTDSGIE